MAKIFVLDTNVLLHNSEAISAFEENTVVLPMAVIEELDNFKSRNDELGRNARQVIRQIDSLRTQGRLGEGVPMPNGGTLRILSSKGTFEELDLHAELPDNRILRVAFNLHRNGDRVIFVSKDINARLKADAIGIEAQDFEKQKINIDELYCGYREVQASKQQIDDFFEDKLEYFEGIDLYPNEFLYMVDETNPKHTALARVSQNKKLMHLNPMFDQAWKIRPRSKEQRMTLELLLDPAVQLVTLVGQAGTGKTLLALAAALESTIKNRRYEKILVSRPIIPLGKDIGYLPGSKDEKLSHWMQPIFDNLAYLMRAKRRNTNGEGPSLHNKVEDLFRQNTIEIEALTYIRGRSIPQQYVIVDEAQNLTPHEVKTIVSRAGEDTKMVLTGDPYQIDNPYLDSSSNGLTYAVERLKGQQIHGSVTLRKSERSALAAIAAEML